MADRESIPQAAGRAGYRRLAVLVADRLSRLTRPRKRGWRAAPADVPLGRPCYDPVRYQKPAYTRAITTWAPDAGIWPLPNQIWLHGVGCQACHFLI